MANGVLALLFLSLSEICLETCLSDEKLSISLAQAAPVSPGQVLLQRVWSRKGAFDETPRQLVVNRSAAPLASLSTPVVFAPTYPKVLKSMQDNKTLFYHVHIPKTGGTTAAHLLVSDICAPYDDLVPLQGWSSQCNVSCEMGFTDNEFSCFPDRNDFEHNAFVLNMRRAEDLKTNIGAEEIVYVTTLRRGSDRLVSQWKAELGYGTFVPPDGVSPFSMQSLQTYITDGPHHGVGWIAAWNPSLRNNLQVGQLASRLIESDTEPLNSSDLEEAKRVLMSGRWIIGFADCMQQFQEKLLEYTARLHGGYKEKLVPVDTRADSVVEIDETTNILLDNSTALDTALYDWAWSLAATSADARFTKTC